MLLDVESAQLQLDEMGRIAASDQRVAFIAEINDKHGHTREYRFYTGPPSGPLALVRTEPAGDGAWVPELVDVDGDRALLVEVRENEDGALRATVFSSSGAAPVRWTSKTKVPIAIAGPWAAVAGDGPQRLAVADLATGAEQASVGLDAAGLNLDLSADGHFIAAGSSAAISLRPGQAFTKLPNSADLSELRLAGDRVVAADIDGRTILLGADGTRTALGPPTSVPSGLAADASGVAWIANGCLYYTSFVPLGATVPANCPTTEVNLYAIGVSHLKGRTVRAPVICVNAPDGTCRGTVIGRFGGKVVGTGSFAIPIGKTGNVPMKLAARVVARFRKRGWGGLIIQARVPNGRTGAVRGGSELDIKVGRGS